MNKFIASINKNSLGIIFIFAAALLISLGQLFWKISEGSYLGWLLSGFALYSMGAVLMIIAFRFGSLSVLHPFLSVSYIFALILGQVFLKEHISTLQLLGIFIIIVGVIFIGGGDD